MKKKEESERGEVQAREEYMILREFVMLTAR
jgi:hypothetical protein